MPCCRASPRSFNLADFLPDTIGDLATDLDLGLDDVNDLLLQQALCISAVESGAPAPPGAGGASRGAVGQRVETLAKIL